MNDVEIRHSFHRKRLRRYHAHGKTLVINELGLDHGRCRADIAVINGCLIGYEIKSDRDSLNRLAEQVQSYNAVFNKVFMIAGERHIDAVQEYIPPHWGLILSTQGPRGAIHFETLRTATWNGDVDPRVLAKLLWRDEVVAILRGKGLSHRVLRQPRATLYTYLIESLGMRELQRVVRECLRTRRNWRYPEQPSLGDGSRLLPPTW